MWVHITYFLFSCVLEPVTPNMTAVSVTEVQYNKFTVILNQDIFNDTNGSVIHYGVLVSSVTDGMSNKPETFMCLLL